MKRRDALVNSTVLIGAGFMVLGLYLIWMPLGIIAAGVVMVAIGVVYA